ncbi:MAG: hypothetical protein IJP31_01045 [Lachnospiraceae bacterium]|nr:hypothetical protein [Lachnospiraceae bacterium]
MKNNCIFRLLFSVVLLLLIVFGLAFLFSTVPQTMSGKDDIFQENLTANLENSIEYADGKIIFTIPEDGAEWNILISGRIEAEGSGGMSIHYLEDTAWENGKTYSFDISDGNYTELGLTAYQNEEEIFIDLMAYLPIPQHASTE